MVIGLKFILLAEGILYNTGLKQMQTQSSWMAAAAVHEMFCVLGSSLPVSFQSSSAQPLLYKPFYYLLFGFLVFLLTINISTVYVMVLEGSNAVKTFPQ